MSAVPIDSVLDGKRKSVGVYSNTVPCSRSDSIGRRKRVAIIGGGGPTGLAALHIFLERSQLCGPDANWEIQAFEARRDVGGVWLPEELGEVKEFPSGTRVPPTPLYNSLTTNLPHPLMAFHDFPFPPETPLYPRASAVLKYLEDYAQAYDLRRYIKFNAEVKSAWWDGLTSQWIIELASESSATNRTHQFDALIVANGHYGLPYIPPLPGFEEWEASDRFIMHSMWYREPSTFKDRVILIVGGGPSGADLVKDSIGIASSVIHSTSLGARTDEEQVKRRPRLTGLRASDGTATYNDGSVDSNIDIVILATGYTLIFPFLKNLPQGVGSPQTALPDALVCTGASLQPLARHTFPLRTYSPNTLAFMGLPSRLAPFPAADIQAEAIATVFLQDEPAPAWNQQLEEALVSKRFEAMGQSLNGDFNLVAQSWHKMFPENHEIGDWDDYRASLLTLAPAHRQNWAVNVWEREIYDAKVELRTEWQTLESEGAAPGWVDGVGKCGAHEWVPLMYRVLEHARKRGRRAVDVLDVTTSAI